MKSENFSTIEKAFLPYKDRHNALTFPIGKFVGVYFSEEFFYVWNLGYRIFPLRGVQPPDCKERGCLYEKKKSLFKGFVSDIFVRRQEVKIKDDVAMVYI